jgi:ribonucleoside-diphosphate reductase subunit M2
MLALFPDEYLAIKSTIINIPVIKSKINFMAKWMADSCTFSERVIAFLCVEAIMFSASFAIIFWFKTRAMLPGTIQANELILKDEGLHQDYGVLIHKYIKNKASAGRIHEIIKESVEIEMAFIKEAIPIGLHDLKQERICLYVQFVADRLAVQLSTPKIYNVVNPCQYMVNLGIESKANFFEKQGTNYLTPSTDDSLVVLDDF